jgi:hypothetical protein
MEPIVISQVRLRDIEQDDLPRLYELHPTADQLSELNRLKQTNDGAYRWVTEEEIRNRGMSPSKTTADIPPTAEWLL